MPHPRSWYLSLILLIILILGLWFVVSEGRLYRTAHYGKLYDSHLLWLTTGAEVKQEFVATYPGLHQIDVFVKNLNPATLTQVIFQLRQNCQSGPDLSKQVVLNPSGEIEGQIFYSFTFAPLEESTDQKYCFILTAEKGDEKLIGVLTGEGNLYPKGQAYYQQTPEGEETAPTPGPDQHGEHKLFLPVVQAHLPDTKNLDLAFQLHYRGSRLGTFQVFLERLVEHKAYFWGKPVFYVLLVALYLISVAILIRMIAR